jgi:hypothetical protein
MCASEGLANSIPSQIPGAEGIVGAALLELTGWLKVTRFAAPAFEDVRKLKGHASRNDRPP